VELTCPVAAFFDEAGALEPCTTTHVMNIQNKPNADSKTDSPHCHAAHGLGTHISPPPPGPKLLEVGQVVIAIIREAQVNELFTSFLTNNIAAEVIRIAA
jgi:hypothetical protein